jgi:hypothetical protein
VSIRRWLPWIAALAVVVVTAVVVLAVPNRHACPGATHAVQSIASRLAGEALLPPQWICVAPGTTYSPMVYATTDHRGPLRIAIALGGLVLAVALGVAVHKAYPPAPSSTAASDADTIRAGPVEGGTT